MQVNPGNISTPIQLRERSRDIEPESNMTFEERLEDWWETIKVKWFMLDAQQKQALILIGVYLTQLCMDVIRAYIIAKVGMNESTES